MILFTLCSTVYKQNFLIDPTCYKILFIYILKAFCYVIGASRMVQYF